MFFKKIALPICNKNHNNYINTLIISVIVKKTHFVGNYFSSNINTTTISLYSSDLIKPVIIADISWSSGMVSNLLFKFNILESQKYSTQLSARKDWGLWKFSNSIWWSQTSYDLQKFKPWSIRIRRFLKINLFKPKLLIINYSFNQFKTPKKSIKRWLKKKYTTQSWR